MVALLFVQSDGTLLVQSQHPDYEHIRPTLASFSELTQRIDPMHVYCIRPLTLWQAASVGVSARDILNCLRRSAAHPIPYGLQQSIVKETQKWGLLSLYKGSGDRVLLRGDRTVLEELGHDTEIRRMAAQIEPEGIAVPMALRGEIKRRVCELGYPIFDRAGYLLADAFPMSLRPETILRDYQQEAVNRFFGGESREESGVIVLPCGAGKTLVGIAIAAHLQLHTLILAPNESAAQQWRRELLAFTDVPAHQVTLYDYGSELTPITITTYQRVTAKTRAGERRHLTSLTSHAWGLVVYDEVHMLPAPLFRLAADLQGVRRLGLTATLVREDGADTDVFSLIGPKRYEAAWKKLEQSGFLSQVTCVQVRIPLSVEDEKAYIEGTQRLRHKIAALNRRKLETVEQLIEQHPRQGILVLGHYLASLRDIATRLDCPLITGDTPQSERELWFEQFRGGIVRCLVLSRVANMAINLPSASVAIQISGLFGSRQEEAQRLGRLLRPSGGPGTFYSLVSRDTVEERLASHRQLYLMEQGYQYQVREVEEIPISGQERLEVR